MIYEGEYWLELLWIYVNSIFGDLYQQLTPSIDNLEVCYFDLFGLLPRSSLALGIDVKLSTLIFLKYGSLFS